MKNVRAVIKRVYTETPASKAGLMPGDIITSVDGYQMLDVIDWRYLTSDYAFSVQFVRDGEEIEVEVLRDGSRDIGIEFEDVLFDGIRECANQCIFCFVDQLPKGTRGSLCIKDDDYRLSFLQGSFVTLTNCSRRTLDRIIDLNMTPLYISVHATDPDVRNDLLGRKATKPIMEIMSYLGCNGIKMHTQIVVVPEVNDGAVLDKSIEDLASLHPSVLSIGVVPVGLTKHRIKHTELRPVNSVEAKSTVKSVLSRQSSFFEKLGTRLVWASDEYFLRADVPFPDEASYEGYPQYENGIGLARSFYSDLRARQSESEWEKDPKANDAIIATGHDGAAVIGPVLKRFEGKYGISTRMLSIENSYLGREVTVTGLITGQDLVKAARIEREDRGFIGRLVIPDIMLRKGEDVFLDGLTPSEVSGRCGLEVRVVPTNAEGLLTAAGLRRKAG